MKLIELDRTQNHHLNSSNESKNGSTNNLKTNSSIPSNPQKQTNNWSNSVENRETCWNVWKKKKNVRSDDKAFQWINSFNFQRIRKNRQTKLTYIKASGKSDCGGCKSNRRLSPRNFVWFNLRPKRSNVRPFLPSVYPLMNPSTTLELRTFNASNPFCKVVTRRFMPWRTIRNGVRQHWKGYETISFSIPREKQS